MTATAWRDSLRSGKVVALFGNDGAVNWAEVGPPQLTAALVEYARIGLAGVVTPCLETPGTRAKRYHAGLRRVFRGAGRPIHVWEYRGRAYGRRSSSVDSVIVWAALGRRCLVVKPRAFSLCPQRVCGSTWRCRVAWTPRDRRFGRPSNPTAPEGPTEKPHPPPPPPPPPRPPPGPKGAGAAGGGARGGGAPGAPHGGARGTRGRRRGVGGRMGKPQARGAA